MKIPMVDLAAQQLRIADELNQSIRDVLKAGEFIAGKDVVRLEQALESYLGCKHALTCANGTDAISLALMALEPSPQQPVFCPSFTFAGTVEPIALAGQTPFFVDVCADTFNMCPNSLIRSIAESKKRGMKPQGIVVVDLFGLPADYTSIEHIAKENDLWLLRDAAQSFGSKFNKMRSLDCCDVTTTSFFPAKPLGCLGDGGAVFTDSDHLRNRIYSLKNHGKGEHKYSHVRVGMNSRLDTIQAAILLVKLRIFDWEIEQRQKISTIYSDLFNSAAEFSIPRNIKGLDSVWAQYTLRLNNSIDRNLFQKSMSSLGVATAVYYPKPLHLQAPYASYPKDPQSLAHSENNSKSVVSIPMHPYLDEKTQRYIAEAVFESCSSASK